MVGVEGAFDAHLLIEVDLAEHLRHQVAFLDADAVLAGQHAADLDAQPQDVGAEALRPCNSPGLLASYRISGCRLPSPA
jgi:hypothetical protein